MSARSAIHRAARAIAALLLAVAVLAVPERTAATGCPSATATVATASQLHTALAAAAPGDVIALDPGTYTGLFVTTVSGTQTDPIWLCGSSASVLNGGSITGGYGLHLDGASWWRLHGFTVTNGQKGVVVDAAHDVIVQGLTVHGVGDEAIHLRTHTVDSLVTGNTIYDTGNRREKFGEGVYIGSSDANWGTLTGGQPDHSDRNVVSYNTIYDVTAEGVDAKEGTADGQIIGNAFDGAGQTEEGADSWVDVKGNGWLISGNTGVHSLLNGYETHHRNLTRNGLGDWGLSNIFENNSADVQAPTGTPDPPRGFYIHDPATTGNVVRCSNTVVNASFYANLACTP